jgi:hypothetical protein
MSSPATLIVSLLVSVLPIVAVALSAVVLIVWWRQRASVRRAGVGPDTPGCAKCLYAVRGWNSPNCPECGADVRQHGVVTGARVHPGLKIAAAFLVVLTITLPLFTLAARALFVRQWNVQMWQLNSTGDPTFEFHLRTATESGTLLAEPRHTTVLLVAPPNTFDGLTISGGAGDWIPQPLIDGADAGRISRVEIGPHDAVPPVRHIEQCIGQFASDETTTVRQQQAAVLHKQISASRASPPAAAQPGPQRLLAGVFGSLSSGSGSGTTIWSPARYAMWFIPVTASIITALIVWRRHRPGWRAAREGEWTLSPRA